MTFTTPATKIGANNKTLDKVEPLVLSQKIVSSTTTNIQQSSIHNVNKMVKGGTNSVHRAQRLQQNKKITSIVGGVKKTKQPRNSDKENNHAKSAALRRL